MLFTSRFANPGKFLRLAERLMPLFAVASVVTFGAGLYLALFNSPPDYQQGETVRIMYIHVPAAWMGMMIYAAMAVAAGVGLVARHTLADIFCVAAAPVGAVFVALCLITGSIWGRPTWGAWWVWDARLTSVLILFLIYCGYIVLRQSFDEHERGFRGSAILILVGAVNIPIVRFSVDWWNTLHQPAGVLRMSGSTVDAHMLRPLLVMVLAYSFFGAFLVLMRMRTEILRRCVEAAALLEDDE
jgi:heme exporter protein C